MSTGSGGMWLLWPNKAPVSVELVLLQGATLDLSAVIGLLMRMAIVTKNSLLLSTGADAGCRAPMAAESKQVAEQQVINA